MKRSLAAGFGFLALARRDAGFGRGSAARRDAVQGTGHGRAVQLDRLLPGHQRRRRLGRLRLEQFRGQQQPVGRHDRRHRRLQLAGHGQPVGVRPRRRHRLDQHQGQQCRAARFNCQTRNNWLGTVRGRVGYSWDRFLPYFTGGLAFGDIEANRTGFAGSATPMPAGPSASASKASSPAIGRPRSNISTRTSATRPAARLLAARDQRRSSAQHSACGPELPLLIKNNARQT